MSNFDETLMKRLTKLEREVERLRVKERPVGGGGGVTDHGALGGLSDNDHPQYLLTTGKAADSDKLDGVDSTGFATAGHNHSGVYLPVSGKAADADKLDGVDSTGFVNTTGTQTVDGTKTFSSIPVLPASNPTTANQAVRKGYADGAYLLTTGKAADSDKLDGIDSTGFATAGHDHDGVYIPLTNFAWQDWTPTVTGWAAGYVVNVARYQLIGKTCFFTLDISGTSNSTAVTATMPFTSYASATSGPVWGGTNSYVQDGGTVVTTSASRWYVGESSNLLIAYTDMSNGAWTASGAKRIRVTGFYEIA